MRVMIVDDNQSLLQSLEIIVKRQGHVPLCFSDPSKGLDALAQGLVPDAVLVDFAMPGMTGIEFMLAATVFLPMHCNTAIMTGHAEILPECELACAGVQYLFPKPLDLSSIAEFLMSRPEHSMQERPVAGREQHGMVKK